MAVCVQGSQHSMQSPSGDKGTGQGQPQQRRLLPRQRETSHAREHTEKGASGMKEGPQTGMHTQIQRKWGFTRHRATQQPFFFFFFFSHCFLNNYYKQLVRNTKRNKRTGNMVGCIPPFWKHETHGCFLFFRASERVATCLPAEGFFLSNYNKIPLSFNLQVLQSEKMANLSEISIQLYNYYLSPYTIQSANKMFRVHGITISKIYLCSIFHSEVVHHLKVRQ